jgi:uncharacterized delta-60 repeat protein
MVGTLLQAIVTALISLALAGAAGGDIDVGFGREGKVLTDFGASDHAFSVAVQPDGKIVAAGTTLSASGQADFALARYLSDGRLDPSFGRDGRVVTDLGGSEVAVDVVVQRDGKIVVAGAGALARYAADGSLDRSFGTDGVVAIRFGRASTLLEREGRLVVAGTARGGFALARFRANGTLDRTFGGDGTIVTRVGGRTSAGDASLTRDGKIVVAGTRLDPRKRSTGDRFPVDLVVGRYRANGTLDRSFGRNGIATYDLRRADCCYAEAIGVQRNDSVVVAGYGERGGRPAVLRLRPDGRRDLGFGRWGQAAIGLGSGVGGLALDGRGRIVVAIRHAATGPGSDLGVVRFTASGRPDVRFAKGSATTTDLGAFDDAWALALQADGKILVAGYSGGQLLSSSDPNDFAVARYLAD